MWKLTDLAEDHIEKLRGEGIILTPQEILYIQQLSLEVSYPDRSAARSKGAPICVGGSVFRPLTIAGAYWFDDAKEHCPDEATSLFAYCYALAYGHDRERMSAVGKEEVLSALVAWKRTLTCTADELFEVVSKVHGDEWQPPPQDNDEGKRYSLSYLVQMAVAMMGGTPELWEYECSIQFVAETVMRAIADRAAAHGAKSGKTDRALLNFGKFIDSIRKAHRTKGEGE